MNRLGPGVMLIVEALSEDTVVWRLADTHFPALS